MNLPKKWHFVFAIVTMISVVWWVSPDTQSPRSVFQKVKHPQEYMTQVSMWSYTETGQLKNEMSANYWAYLPETKASQLNEPHLIVYKPDNTLWHIKSKKGRILQPTVGVIDEVELMEDVEIERPGSAKVMPLKLETSVIRYRPKTEYAETDQFITMTKPDLKITGTGMKAFLDKNFVELLHNVKTYYMATKP